MRSQHADVAYYFSARNVYEPSVDNPGIHYPKKWLCHPVYKLDKFWSNQPVKFCYKKSSVSKTRIWVGLNHILRPEYLDNDYDDDGPGHAGF